MEEGQSTAAFNRTARCKVNSLLCRNGSVRRLCEVNEGRVRTGYNGVYQQPVSGDNVGLGRCLFEENSTELVEVRKDIGRREADVFVPRISRNEVVLDRSQRTPEMGRRWRIVANTEVNLDRDRKSWLSVGFLGDTNATVAFAERNLRCLN